MLLASCGDDFDRCNYEGVIGTSDKIYMWTTKDKYQGGAFGGLRGAHQICTEDLINQEWLHQKADMFSHRAALSSRSNGCDARTIIPSDDHRDVYTKSNSLVSSRYAEFYVSSLPIANSVGNDYWTGFGNGSLLSPDDCRGWTNSGSLSVYYAQGGVDGLRLTGPRGFCDEERHILCVSF